MPSLAGDFSETRLAQKLHRGSPDSLQLFLDFFRPAHRPSTGGDRAEFRRVFHSIIGVTEIVAATPGGMAIDG
jgi:hypothetical protein